MGSFKTLTQTTVNRFEFNRAYKRYLEHNGEIHCSRCGYHRGENDERKWYGESYRDRLRFPNWKLVSKNRKQWMIKPMKIVTEYRINHDREYTHIEF
jgi:hypothetical protein